MSLWEELWFIWLGDAREEIAQCLCRPQWGEVQHGWEGWSQWTISRGLLSRDFKMFGELQRTQCSLAFWHQLRTAPSVPKADKYKAHWLLESGMTAGRLRRNCILRSSHGFLSLLCLSSTRTHPIYKEGGWIWINLRSFPSLHAYSFKMFSLAVGHQLCTADFSFLWSALLLDRISWSLAHAMAGSMFCVA